MLQRQLLLIIIFLYSSLILFSQTDGDASSNRYEIEPGFPYVNVEVEIEVSSSETTYLEHNSDLKLKKEMGHLEPVVLGEKSLYSYKPKESRENFYIKTENGYELLKHKRYVFIGKIGYVIKNKNIYVAQLNEYLKACPKISKHAQKTEYKREELIAVFKEYYKCKGAKSYNYEEDDEPKIIKTNVGVVGGVSATKFNFIGGTGFGDIDFEVSYRPVAGLYLNFVFPNLSQIFSSYNELLMSSYVVDGKTAYLSFVDSTINTRRVKISRNYFKVNSFLRCKKAIGKFSVYINAGLSIGFGVSSNSEEWNNSVPITLTSNRFEKYAQNIEKGLLLGAGIKYNKITLSLRGELGNGIGRSGIESSANRLFLLVGYDFSFRNKQIEK